MTVSRRWYVVQTHPHAEAKAAAHLVRQGFETYLPRYRKRRRHARQVDLVAAPLFPRYLFVAVDMATQRWRSIQSTFGVARLVANGDAPAPVTDQVVDGLRSREDEGGFVKLETRVQFAPGQKIQVLNGVFETCLGLFEGIADHERVAILLNFLGRKVRVVLETAAVAAV
ncbi:MAG: transcriptional activator RfaH [Alphaproteobacteria bacterium]|nr:transcriptional activator RfaH [Alphaproteobacteria bacterium]